MKLSYGGATLEITTDEIKALTVDELMKLIDAIHGAIQKLTGKV